MCTAIDQKKRKVVLRGKYTHIYITITPVGAGIIIPLFHDCHIFGEHGGIILLAGPAHIPVKLN